MRASPVKLFARPRLREPNMLAAWPGVGDVAMIAASYLLKKLPFKELGEVEASNFFDPIGVLVRDGVVEEPQFPRSAFYYWKNKDSENDLILFIGEDQPTVKGYDLANCVLDVGVRFGISRLFTCAAALTRIHHTEQSKVWGVATTPEGFNKLSKYNLVNGGNVQIAGLNGLLLGVAKERGIEGVCLLGEVPAYASRLENPMAALSVLEAITKIMDIRVDVNELEELAIETREKIKQAASEAMGEYIDNFTQPIWEQGQEEGDEEDEEDEEGFDEN
jgi:uncharacterized protein